MFGAPDPNREAAGGAERLRAAGVEAEDADSWEARTLDEAWRTWVSLERPFVIYKTAMTLDGSLAVPGERWVSGPASRRLVHELRAQVDAVAVGGGTARADRPRLDARDVPTPKGQPRRIAFSRGPLPDGLDLELRTGALEDELRALAGEGVQSLLLEGGPTAGRGVLPRRTSSTSCSSSSHRRWPAPGRVLLLRYPPRARCRISPPGGSAATCSSRRMSTKPDSQRADDQLVTHLSHWLTRQLGNDELRRRLEEIGTDELAPGGRDAVNELLAELATAVPGERAQLEVLVRETVETLVYGD